MNPDGLARLTVAEAAALIATRKISPIELTQGYLQRIRRFDPLIRSYLLVTEESALDQARTAEREIAAGHYRGPMHGIPCALKDNIETAGIRTTAQSRLLEDHVPAEDATVVRRLKAAGAVLLGKLSCLELTHGSPSPDQLFPPCVNPWNTAHGFTGGSSTGSAAAVAASLALATIGTDTGGSIRNPASLCAVSGIMPTYGRVSRRGIVPYSFSLDHVGPLAWTAEDCAMVLGVIAGFDPHDPGSVDRPVPYYQSALSSDLSGVRVGWVRHFYERDTIADDQTRTAISETATVLQELGAAIEETSVRPLVEYHDCKLILSAAEFYAVHEADFSRRFSEFGRDLQVKTFPGAFVSAADYIQAQRQRRRLASDMQERMSSFDVLLTASNLGPAPRIADGAPDPASFFSRQIITGVFNVTANPAISICCGFSATGLPLAVQIVGKPFDEATVLRVAHAFERATPWHKRRPIFRECTATAH